MFLRYLSVRALLLLLGICLIGPRGLASAAETKEPKKIAVIGGGIGGSAAAYFLRQEFGASVKIDVFEAGTVGGRTATENVKGQDYEIGAAVIHPLNLHLKHFVETLGLSPRAEVKTKMAIFNGKELTFEESDWFIVNFIRMLWRYGFNSYRKFGWVEGILGKFMSVYQYQKFGYAFSSVEQLLRSVDAERFLNQTLEEAMRADGFSQAFINDIVTPNTRINFGLNAALNAFVGVVSLADGTSGLWTVEGGNKRMSAGLLQLCKAEIIQGRVTGITLKTSKSASQYEVNYSVDSGPSRSLYDIVIIATPLHKGLSDISFSGFSPPIPSHFSGDFQQIVNTLVLGRLNMSYLGTDQRAADFLVSDILTTDNKALPFNSLATVAPVKIPQGYAHPPASANKVWKMFSAQPLSEEQLGEMFESQEGVWVKRWLAYPSYTPPNHRTPPFILHDHLYYVNAIEWAASCMEMSALSARNAALLAYNRWHGHAHKIDQEDLETRLRTEL
ncbi:prenylcysteine oxidase-like [Astyanax mexicanus]|uniref:Prenylcysteine oxidase 1 n=1 Tax=Astyanax mexicanus TaxID=7994 RepID=A0A8B9RIP5_ASTMX|nr:prenylcysteine oxidase-like [Astyanax mexicanus]